MATDNLSLLNRIVFMPRSNRILSRCAALALRSFPHLLVVSTSMQMFLSARKKSSTNSLIGYWHIGVSPIDCKIWSINTSCGHGFLWKVWEIETALRSFANGSLAGFFFLRRSLDFFAHSCVSFLRPKAQCNSPLVFVSFVASCMLRSFNPLRLHSLWNTSRETLHSLLNDSKDFFFSQWSWDIISSKLREKCCSILSNARIRLTLRLKVLVCQK